MLDTDTITMSFFEDNKVGKVHSENLDDLRNLLDMLKVIM